MKNYKNRLFFALTTLCIIAPFSASAMETTQQKKSSCKVADFIGSVPTYTGKRYLAKLQKKQFKLTPEEQEKITASFVNNVKLLRETRETFSKTKNNREALQKAVLNDIIAGADVNTQLKDDQTALHFAALDDDLPILQTLLMAKANPNVFETEYGGTALHWVNLYVVQDAIQTKNAVVLSLIKHKANVNAQDKKKGYTALIDVAGKGIDLIAKTLIDNGAEVNAENMGLCALYQACHFNCKSMAQLLLENNADVNASVYKPIQTILRGSSRDFYPLLLKWGAQPYNDKTQKQRDDLSEELNKKPLSAELEAHKKSLTAEIQNHITGAPLASLVMQYLSPSNLDVLISFNQKNAKKQAAQIRTRLASSTMPALMPPASASTSAHAGVTHSADAYKIKSDLDDDTSSNTTSSMPMAPSPSVTTSSVSSASSSSMSLSSEHSGQK